MARRSSVKILSSLEGKLGVIRREVLKVLRGLKREIARREADLAGVKAEFARGMDLLRGKGRQHVDFDADEPTRGDDQVATGGMSSNRAG